MHNEAVFLPVHVSRNFACHRTAGRPTLPLRLAWLISVVFMLASVSLLGGENTFVQPSRGASGKELITSGDYQATVEKAKCALETLRAAVEEWGTLTVSEPLVVLDTGQFALPGSFDDTPAYIKRARADSVQGGAAQVQSRALGNSLAIEVQPNFTVDLSGKKTPLTGASTDPGAAPTPPNQTAATDNTGDLFTNGKPGDTLRPISTSDKDHPSNFQLSDSVAVPIGESAKIVELLGQKLANPNSNSFTNPDVGVHFAIVQISCNPGWRTRENYIGDVTANCEFYRSSDQQLQDASDEIRPHVFSVLPLFDAQTLELANSDRQISQLVTQISAAYPTSVANLRASDLIRLAREFRSDVATRTPRTVTNSYSTGSCFGFRFAPSLVALKDPAQRRSGAANILQATSFPALVTIIVNQRHAYAKHYDSVMVHVTHRWLINDRPPLRTFWRRFTTPLQRDQVCDDFELADAAEKARNAIEGLPGVGVSRLSPNTPATYGMLYRQYLELRAKAIGTSRPIFSFPWTAKTQSYDGPQIGDVTPRRIALANQVAMVVRGFHFAGKMQDFEVWLGQRKGTIKQLSRNPLQGDRLFVMFEPLAKNDPSLSDEGTLSLMVKGPQGVDVKPDAVEIIKQKPVAAANAAGAGVAKNPKTEAAAAAEGTQADLPAAPDPAVGQPAGPTATPASPPNGSLFPNSRVRTSSDPGPPVLPRERAVTVTRIPDHLDLFNDLLLP